ncbi:MAG: Cys-tRNA(Pro) deacylase [Pseudomonadota bacterium]
MTPAIKLLERTKTPHRVIEYEHRADAESFGIEAATVLDQPPAQVFKTLLADVGQKKLVVAMVPVSGNLDLKALASAAKSKRALMADPKEAQRITGYLIGGISPLGQKRQLPSFLDETALDFDEIFVSGGRRGLELALRPDHLIALTNATTAAIAKAI